MRTRTVEELMVPIAEYATVYKESTLYDAVVALEKAQQEYNKSRYPHRAILVCDEKNNVIGKVSQLDILKALEPQYDRIMEKGSLGRFGFSREFQRSLIDQYKLWDMPLKDICRKSGTIKVKDFMYTPGEGEYVASNATMDEAIHQLVMGHHQSLLATKGGNIVGILRLTDVFMAVFEAIVSTCKI